MTSFTLHKTCSHTKARLGTVHTPHGDIQTPIFMPVGTRGTVKAMSPAELESLDAQVILGNTYHLMLKPGVEIIRPFGGLHEFMGWNHPILTDSGGFQVFSLAQLRKIKSDGVEFSSHIDGSRFFLGPKESIAVQRVLNSDIVMAFDECTPYPATYEQARKSLDLTLKWEAVSREQPLNPGQQMFGIVQGSVYQDLRIEAAQRLAALDFEGYALGGLAVGEPEESMYHCIDWVEPHLPAHKPRYLMGVGVPHQLIESVARGVDMFDCVMPTRLARHGVALTPDGPMHMKNLRWAKDPRPIDPEGHPHVTQFSRAYIRHLFKAGEMLALRLLSFQNLEFYLRLMADARAAIQSGQYSAFKSAFISRYKENNII